MSEANVDLLKKGYADFNAGNIDDVLAIYDAAIEWTEPGGGNSPSGTFTGPDTVAQEVFAKVAGNFDEFSSNVENYDDQGDTVVASGAFKGKSKNGKQLSSSFEHTFVLSDGKITKFNNNVMDPDNWAEVWS